MRTRSVPLKLQKKGTYIPVDTCCHYQFCFALQMRQSGISLEQEQNLSLNWRKLTSKLTLIVVKYYPSIFKYFCRLQRSRIFQKIASDAEVWTASGCSNFEVGSWACERGRCPRRYKKKRYIQIYRSFYSLFPFRVPTECCPFGMHMLKSMIFGIH